MKAMKDMWSIDVVGHAEVRRREIDEQGRSVDTTIQVWDRVSAVIYQAKSFRVTMAGASHIHIAHRVDAQCSSIRINAFVMSMVILTVSC